MNSKGIKAIQAQMKSDAEKATKIRSEISKKKEQIASINYEIAALERQLDKYPVTSEDSSFLENLDAVRKSYGV